MVRKELAAGSDTATFHYAGNISYAPNGLFDLTVNNGDPAETSFALAAGDTWSFVELTDPVYELADPPTCTSTNGQSTFRVTGSRVDVTLGTGDLAVCTYVNQRRPTGPLALFKATSGAVGSFDFRIHRPDDLERTQTVTTRDQNTPVLVAAAPNGPNGQWTVAETLPPDVGGSWDLVRFQCDGEDVPFTTTDTTGEATFNIPPGEERSCTAVNAFSPGGRSGS